MKYFLKKLLGHEIFRSMASWATKNLLKKFVKPSAVRWIQTHPRWIYSVPGPNSLWYNDGLHSNSLEVCDTCLHRWLFQDGDFFSLWF